VSDFQADLQPSFHLHSPLSSKQTSQQLSRPFWSCCLFMRNHYIIPYFSPSVTDPAPKGHESPRTADCSAARGPDFTLIFPA
jgi:hypothetical protein